MARRDFESRLDEPLTKAGLPRDGIPRLAAAKEAEVAEAAVEKMLGGHAADGRVVHVDRRNPELRQRAGDVHHRPAQTQHGPGHPRVKKVGNNAVGLPFTQRAHDLQPRRTAAEYPRLPVHRVDANAAQHVAAETRILAHD